MFEFTQVLTKRSANVKVPTVTFANDKAANEKWNDAWSGCETTFSILLSLDQEIVAEIRSQEKEL